MGISQETRDRAENLRINLCDKLTLTAIENAQVSIANTSFEAAIKEILDKEAVRR